MQTEKRLSNKEKKWNGHHNERIMKHKQRTSDMKSRPKNLFLFSLSKGCWWWREKEKTDREEKVKGKHMRDSDDDDDVTSFSFIFDAIFILTSHVKFTLLCSEEWNLLIAFFLSFDSILYPLLLFIVIAWIMDQRILFRVYLSIFLVLDTLILKLMVEQEVYLSSLTDDMESNTFPFVSSKLFPSFINKRHNNRYNSNRYNSNRKTTTRAKYFLSISTPFILLMYLFLDPPK